MDQEKIGKFIREIRIKQKLSQQKFAQKYGVSYQAVSKWENGKNIPDISILKQMCSEQDINLDDFLDTKIPVSKNKKRNRLIIIAISLVVLTMIILLLIYNSKDSFQFKTISTNCEHFNLYGSLAYDSKKASIYISNITYCGGDDTNKYKKIDCSLYCIDDDTKTKISTYNYDEEKGITIEDFLKDISFNIDNYEKKCNKYDKNTLQLEIDLIDDKGKTISHNIPLKLDENCK